jgi:predicted O-methyltransferase YrrM
MEAREKLKDSQAARTAYQLRVLWRDRGMARRRPREAWQYMRHSRELSNFTYELANENELAPFVARALGVDPLPVARYLEELRTDRELIGGLGRSLRSSERRDDEPLLGKRRALYAAVRALRPQVVAETGTHDGLGSAVLLRALERNEREGSPGRLLSFDVNPDAGWLIDRDRHRDRLELIIGDTTETLEPALSWHWVDLFIQDSLKTHEHESFEFETAVRNRMRGGPLVLYTDDAAATGAIREVARRHDGTIETLQEEPLDHYWQGNLLGFCRID